MAKELVLVPRDKYETLLSENSKLGVIRPVADKQVSTEGLQEESTKQPSRVGERITPPSY